VKLFLRLLKMSFLNTKEYTAEFFGEILFLPITVLVIGLFWKGISFASPTIVVESGMTGNQLVYYYVVVSSVQYALSQFWYLNYPIYTDIIKGNLSIYLSRPIDYMTYTCFKHAGNLFMRLLLSGISLLVTGWLLPDITIKISSILKMFYILIELEILIFSIQFLIASISFHTEAIFGIRDLLYSCFYFLGGLIVPIPLMPHWFQNVVNILPFRFLYDYPAQLLLGKITTNLTEQRKLICWMIILFTTARILFTRNQKYYAANGG